MQLGQLWMELFALDRALHLADASNLHQSAARPAQVESARLAPTEL